ncbi:M4 family metallopeptidase [Hydrocarboniphaga sp.]|uniref:M4 family metallopeptidase n=1 Tax=Hydrocarboniphaga sp. TaxID=2033016 RepID=UPI0026191AA1|nr:M4 family metallopeptidase [Hydrocarboniphaga sp.]
MGIAAAILSAAAGAAGGDRSAAVQKAEQQIKAHAAAVFSSSAERYKMRDVILDANGAQHVRFDRSYNGLRVIGGDFVVHSDSRGGFKGVSLTLSRVLTLGTDAAASEADAIRAAESTFAGQRDGAASISKVIYARSSEPKLAYDVVLRGFDTHGTPSVRHVLVDANTLASLESWDEVNTAATPGTGNSLTSGQVVLTTDSNSSGGYDLRDPSRGSQYTVDMKNKQVGQGKLFVDSDNVWGDSTTSDRATAAVDATYGENLTWDYYLARFNRKGIANDGVGASSRVHYYRNYVNAFWSDSCFCMTYGDGDGDEFLPLVAIDVTGHEMTHGVTSRTAALTYSGESGGLNEGISDVFGTLVEYYANNAINPPNYLIGERIYAANNGVATPTTALRYMFKPSLDGTSPDCYNSAIGHLDVHYSSGVLNHFFYLLTQGAVSPPGFSIAPVDLVCDGNTALKTIGQSQAAQIMYRALTVYMTSSTNYSAARAATLSAATDLYGAGSKQYNAVAAAWSSVSVF